MNNNKIYKSERHFYVFDFHISLRQLLLRSHGKGEINNIDIVFFDTLYMQLPVDVIEPLIKVVNSNTVLLPDFVQKEIAKDDMQVFELQCENGNYYVVAGYMNVYENRLDFLETSVGREVGGRDNLVFSTHRKYEQ